MKTTKKQKYFFIKEKLNEIKYKFEYNTIPLLRFVFIPFSKKKYYTDNDGTIYFTKNPNTEWELYDMGLGDYFGEDNWIAFANDIMDVWNNRKTMNFMGLPKLRNDYKALFK